MFKRRDVLRAGGMAPVASAFFPPWAQATNTMPKHAGLVRAEMTRFVQGLPKAEFHVHLEGTLEAGMKLELSRRNNIKIPYKTESEIISSYKYVDLKSFLKIYYEGVSLLITEQDFYDLTYAYLVKAISQNIVHAEMFFDPQAHLNRGIALETVVSGITRAREDARRKLGISSELILCFVRDLSADSAMMTLKKALPIKEHFVGIGLDSDEKGNPPIKFAEHFAMARAAGLKITVHCDVNQQHSLEHIRQALEDIKVDRIDHGGNILQSPHLMAIARQQGMAFTICPSFSGEITHNGQPINVFRGMLDNGLDVTINSDDPAYMGSAYLTDVIIKAERDSRLTKSEIITMQRNAFKAAWIGADQKRGFLDSLDSYQKIWQ